MCFTIEIIANDGANLTSPANGFKPFGRIFKFQRLPRSFGQGRELSARGGLLRYRIGALYVREIHGLFK
jgi:long-chain acyl-CoA synthetase